MFDTNATKAWWLFFHRFSQINVPNNFDTIVILGIKLLQCANCQSDALPFYQTIGNHKNSFEKIHILHNYVNRKLNKKIYSLTESKDDSADIWDNNKIQWEIFLKYYFSLLFLMSKYITQQQLDDMREFSSLIYNSLNIPKKINQNAIEIDSRQNISREQIQLQTFDYYNKTLSSVKNVNLPFQNYKAVYGTVPNKPSKSCGACAKRHKLYMEKHDLINDTKQPKSKVQPQPQATIIVHSINNQPPKSHQITNQPIKQMIPQQQQLPIKVTPKPVILQPLLQPIPLPQSQPKHIQQSIPSISFPIQPIALSKPKSVSLSKPIPIQQIQQVKELKPIPIPIQQIKESKPLQEQIKSVSLSKPVQLSPAMQAKLESISKPIVNPILEPILSNKSNIQTALKPSPVKSFKPNTNHVQMSPVKPLIPSPVIPMSEIRGNMPKSTVKYDNVKLIQEPIKIVQPQEVILPKIVHKPIIMRNRNLKSMQAILVQRHKTLKNVPKKPMVKHLSKVSY